ncbi:hypothetical protein SDC9_60271 [bioreactor metagenome]|uniref:Uncharacterized protein n=1 Tax=bioreactor metagenome TaxID=1076179 RepID=A0A644XDT6_9ZZZZ
MQFLCLGIDREGEAAVRFRHEQNLFTRAPSSLLQPTVDRWALIPIDTDLRMSRGFFYTLKGAVNGTSIENRNSEEWQAE